MRGAYTAGVLDFFLDNEIEFKNCYAVSAGSANGSSYISKQRGRAYHADVDFLNDRNYASFYSLFKTGNFFGTDMCYETIPKELLPYDYEAFNNYDGNFYAVVTNCNTGQPEYLKLEDMEKQIDYIRASCSLPLMAQIVNINGKPYLDGGISDAIPVRKSVKDGNKRNVVVLTRDISYRKKPNEMLPIIKVRYKKYPKLVEAVEKRHIVYNRTLDYIANQEREGNILVIRPSSPITIGRLEKDKAKLTHIYKQGYRDAKNKSDELMKFLGK